MTHRPVWAEIDLDAIYSNTALLRTKLCNNASLCAVVKADAYGHGAVEVSRAAIKAGASSVSVAILDEAVQLRMGGIEVPIIVLGYTSPEQAELLACWNIEQTVFSREQAEALSSVGVAKGKPLPVHLKVDTGMNRLGVSPDQAAEFASLLSVLPGLKLQGVYTHFSDADSLDNAYTLWQHEQFLSVIRTMQNQQTTACCCHAGNSAALLRYPETHFDMVRAGIMLYGYWPSREMDRSIALTPAMCLKTRIVLLKHVPAGTAVGYGRRHITQSKARIGTLPLGYADGYSRRLSGVAEVVVRGVRVPVVGNICMDQCMIDVSGVEGVSEGDEVIVFGKGGVSVEEVADWLGTIEYEVLCMVRNRIPRKYLQTNQYAEQ